MYNHAVPRARFTRVTLLCRIYDNIHSLPIGILLEHTLLVSKELPRVEERKETKVRYNEQRNCDPFINPAGTNFLQLSLRKKRVDKLRYLNEQRLV